MVSLDNRKHHAHRISHGQRGSVRVLRASQSVSQSFKQVNTVSNTVFLPDKQEVKTCKMFISCVLY